MTRKERRGKRIRTLQRYHPQNRPDKRDLSLDELPAPSVAIRAHCLECVGFRAADVRKCDGNLPHGKCHLWPHRVKTKRGAGSPGKAIRRECLACMGNSPQSVADCPSTRCALWPYRFGANPRTNRQARARFEAARRRQSHFLGAGATEGASGDPEVVPEADGEMEGQNPQ